MSESIRQILGDPLFLVVWGANTAVGLAVLIHDLRSRNPQIMPLMKAVWLLTVLYSGLLGLAVYFYSGRRQISHDSLWRRGFRSVAHCYSGCGAGEVAGVLIAAGLLALGNWWVVGLTFALAYVFGFGMTIGPLMQEGESFRDALKDAVYSETASITVMEIVAMGVDLWLAGNATMGEPLFWASLIVSLTLGLLAAYPVNVLLVHYGVKEGMANPKEAHAHG